MSVELGFGLSSSDILQQAMSREMGGWPYNDIWTQSLQNTASLPYTTAMALSEAMQHMPNFSGYLSPVNRFVPVAPFQRLPSSYIATCGLPHGCGPSAFLQTILSLVLCAC